MNNLNCYQSFLIKALEKEIKTATQQNQSYLFMDIGELKFLLNNVISKSELSSSETDEEHTCISCGLLTTVTRAEQYIIKQHSSTIEVKCLNCLIDTLKMDQRELEQLKAVNWFLNDHDLEEDFNKFLKELNHRDFN